MTSLSIAHNRNRLARKWTNGLMLGLTVLAAIVAVTALVLVLAYLVIGGCRYINWRELTSDPDDGIRSSIVGTLVLLAVAMPIGLPLGILGGIYQLESKGRFAHLVRFLTDVLNSVPSIIVGLFVCVMVVNPVGARHPGSGQSAIAGGIALAVIMIPTIMRTTEEILRLVPTSLREGSLALGASRARTMFSIILPAARNGIITGVMLALARIAGETAPLLFTAGGNSHLSVVLTAPIDSLPYRIYTAYQDSVASQAMSAALVLIVLIFGMSLVTRLVTVNRLLEEK